MSHTAAARPLQIFSLFKILAYPRAHGNKEGDGTDSAFTAGITGRTIVDVGLHNCESLVLSVKRGFVVHGFEPVPEHMANCHASLTPGTYVDAPVGALASGALTLQAWRDQQRCYLRGSGSNATRGFAFLYQAAASNVTSFERNSLRIDDAVDTDLYLLKLDGSHGHDGRPGEALEGAARLFGRRAVAHVFLRSFNPHQLRRGGTAPRAVLELLHAAGFVCFDTLNPNSASAMPKDHELGVDSYLDEMEQRIVLPNGTRIAGDAGKSNASVDTSAARATHHGVSEAHAEDLACVNVVKVWRPAWGRSLLRESGEHLSVVRAAF